MSKSILVTDETHKQLTKLVSYDGCKTINDVIARLLNEK